MGKIRLCEICDCNKLCRYLSAKGIKGIACNEIRAMIEEIIAKNIDEEED